MASIGCRAGRMLSGLYRVSRLSKSAGVKVNQSNIRTLVISSSKHLQAQVLEKNETSAEEHRKKVVNPNKSLAEDNIDRLLYRVDLEMRRSGRVYSDAITTVMKAIETSRCCTSTQGHLLIRCLGSANSTEKKSERSKLVTVVLTILKSYLKMDVSHYNAVLKVHFENENPIDISAFVAEMEANGVPPNRVTYQHLIGLYCMEGNIGGATTVLEHMKGEDMAINESVFHSLLMGHCINKDKASVQETLEVMNASGLIPGAETYTVILTACAKARDWERVEEVLVEAQRKDIQLDAGDYFKVIVALCENGMAEQAKPLVARIPKRAGYFQEMRNALPQIIFSGQADLAFDIFMDFKNPEGLEVSNFGTFLSKALAKSTVDPNKCAEIIVKMVEKGYMETLNTYILDCAQQDKMDNLTALGSQLKESSAKLPNIDTIAILKRQVSQNTPVAVINETVKLLREAGLRVEYGILCKDIIFKTLNLDTMQPSHLVSKIKSELSVIPLRFIQNNMITILLEKSNPRCFQACAGYLLNARIDSMNPNVWKRSLAKSLENTKSINDFVSILFAAKIKLESPEEQESLYSALEMLETLKSQAESDTTHLELLTEVVKELNTHKIGVPRVVADRINKKLADKNLEELLDVSVSDFESTVWTEESIGTFLDARRLLYKEGLKKAGHLVPIVEKRVDYDSLEDMLRIDKDMKKRKDFNAALSYKIIKVLASTHDTKRLSKELEEVKERDATFTIIGPVTLNNIIQCYIKSNDIDGALKFFNENGKEWFFSTFFNIVESYARQGNNAKVLELLAQMPEKTLLNIEDKWPLILMDIYVNAGDVEKINQVFNTIVDSGTKVPRKRLLPYLVRVHLIRDDVPAAILAFEDAVKKFKILPSKNDLFRRLVQDENVESLQKVIDLSISVIGEEMSLYDLTAIFLEEGRRAQAKKMLETPGLRYNQKCISRIMNYFVKHQKLDCLEDLVRLTKNVFSCDRDYMYLTWVSAVFQTPEKVREIWMEIQEEGHAPSTTLKTEIAKSLMAANMEIPFVTSDLDLQGERVVNEAESKTIVKPRKQNKLSEIKENKVADAKKEEGKTQPTIAKAIAEKNADALVAALMSQKSSEKDLLAGLDYLGKEEMFDQAIEVVKNNRYLHQTGPVMTLVEKMFNKNKMEEIQTLLAALPEKTRKRIGTDHILRVLQLRTPESFLQAVKSTTTETLSNISIPLKNIKAFFDESQELREALDQLAVEGLVPAAVVLGKVSCYTQDAEGLAKYWSLDTREDKDKVARDIIVRIDTLEKLRWVNSALNGQVAVLRRASNQCLTYCDKKEAQEILSYAMQHGLTLNNLQMPALERLVSIWDFPQKEELRSILKDRRPKSSSTTS